MAGSASSSPSSSSSSPSSSSQPSQLAFDGNKGIRFFIKTGKNEWACTVQDRASYERMKASRTSSSDSVASLDPSGASTTSDAASSSSGSSSS